MSAAIISSLVRCDEWGRKYEKEDNTTETKRCLCGTESTWHMARQFIITSLKWRKWMRAVCIANVYANGNKLRDVHVGLLLFTVCRVSSAWMTSLKIQTILKLDGSLPNQTLPLEKRTRGEQSGVNVGLQINLQHDTSITHCGSHPHWAVQKDSWTQVSWKGKHRIRLFLYAAFTVFHSFLYYYYFKWGHGFSSWAL